VNHYSDLYIATTMKLIIVQNPRHLMGVLVHWVIIIYGVQLQCYYADIWESIAMPVKHSKVYSAVW